MWESGWATAAVCWTQERGGPCLTQTYTVSFTPGSTHHVDSRARKGAERSRTLKALATPHVSQTATCVKPLLPRCTFHTFLENVCFFSPFFSKPGQENESKSWIVFLTPFVCRLRSLLRLFHLVKSSVFLLIPLVLCSPAEAVDFPREYLCLCGAYHKERHPVLSFPQWQWESWPRTWALSMSLTKTYVPLLPVINDCIRHGSRDILGRQERAPTPHEFYANWGESEFHCDTKRCQVRPVHCLVKCVKLKCCKALSPLVSLVTLLAHLLVLNNVNQGCYNSLTS